MLLSRLSREERFLAEVIKPDKPGVVLDRETTLCLAKEQSASYLIAGRILEAVTSQGNSGISIPTLGKMNSSSVTKHPFIDE